MDILVKIGSFHIKQNVLNLKSTLLRKYNKNTFLNLPYRTNILRKLNLMSDRGSMKFHEVFYIK